MSAVPRSSILIVDPDAEVRDLYRHTLQPIAARVEEAADGAQALAKTLASVPDLVITELHLPRLDGTALCGLLRDDRQTQHIPLLVVSRAAPDEAVALRALAAGADDVLPKTCTPEQLLASARALLTRGQRRPAPSEPESAPTRPRSRACHRGVTTEPPTPPPPLHCPRCDRPLEFRHTCFGGVSDRFAERWDYYACPTCGPFQYRHRTRRLRPVDPDPRA